MTCAANRQHLCRFEIHLDVASCLGCALRALQERVDKLEARTAHAAPAGRHSLGVPKMTTVADQ